jgi:hypothetical protein
MAYVACCSTLHVLAQHVVLTQLHSFGLKLGIRDNIAHVAESQLVYPVGRHVAMYG